MDRLLQAIADMVDCTDASKLVGKVKALTHYQAKATSMEEENRALCWESEKFRTEVEKVKGELKEVQDRAIASKRALAEVKDALSFLVDLMN